MKLENWNQILSALPNPHILQTSEWADIKKEVGWQAEPVLIFGDDGQPAAGALVLTRSLSLPVIGTRYSVCYVPRGPLLDWTNASLRKKILDTLEVFCLQKKAIFIKIDPEVDWGTGIPGSSCETENETGKKLTEELTEKKWQYSSEQIQFKNTVMIDLGGAEETWLARMKQKTRYNIRLAEKNGVQIREGKQKDLPLLYRMYAQTAHRDHFIIREESYYHRLWGMFLEEGYAVPLIAEVDGQAVAAIIMFVLGKRAWYFYGMSTTSHREKMPNYLLQWEAMKKAKALGCEVYDLWGAPDTFTGEDSMSGVYRFKEGLGGVLHRTIGAWDYPTKPFLYTIYQHVLPRVQNLTRKIRAGKIRQEVE